MFYVIKLSSPTKCRLCCTRETDTLTVVTLGHRVQVIATRSKGRGWWSLRQPDTWSLRPQWLWEALPHPTPQLLHFASATASPSCRAAGWPRHSVLPEPQSVSPWGGDGNGAGQEEREGLESPRIWRKAQIVELWNPRLGETEHYKGKCNDTNYPEYSAKIFRIHTKLQLITWGLSGKEIRPLS